MSGATKKIEKSASQGSGNGSVSAHAKKERESASHHGSGHRDKGDDKGGKGGSHSHSPKHGDHGKGQKADGPTISPSPSMGVIKTPGKKTEEAPTPGRRPAPTPAATGAAEGGEKKTEKGILKNKKSRTKSDVKNKNGAKSKAKPKAHKRSAFEKIALAFGFHVGEVTLTDPWAIEAAQALDLQQWHLRRLKLRFDKIDLDGSGNIDYDEFFESIGENRSPFSDKLFALIDLDGSGTIEFDEYVRVMATYCMFTKDEILRFCFECFDVDKSGTIDEKEFVELCKCINNASPAFPSNFKKALEEFDVNEDGLIDFQEFCGIDARYPLVLFPAFRLQDVMQRNSLGESAWLDVIENYQRSKQIEEYKAMHGGRLPPDPPLTMLGKLFCPCFYRQKVHIKVGMDMETRHRE